MSANIYHYPCNRSYYTGDHLADYSRALTAWNLNDQYTIPNNATLTPVGTQYANATLYFTPTVPKCYASRPWNPSLNGGAGGYDTDGRDSCNIVFNAWPNGDNSGASLRYFLNGVDVGGCFLSGKAQNGATQGYDLAITQPYSDTIRNTLIIKNVSASTIQLDHFKIYRTYKMCNPNVLDSGNCPNCDAGTIRCSGGHHSGTQGSFDSTRFDIPCNCYNGGSLSYSHNHDMHNAGSILTPPGGTCPALSWTFNFSDGYNDPNYQGSFVSIHNFNNISAVNTDTNPDHDIELALILTVNNTEHTINNYYLSRIQGQALAPSYDLTQSQYYVDNGPNTVTLRNLGSVDVLVSPGAYGGIDIYRIYKSTTLCDPQCESGQTECPTCECGCVTCQGCYFCETCATPCYSCISCQEGCEICEEGCEVCEVGCEVCEVGCEITCNAGCEVSCETGCEVSCETGCEVSCQTGCQVSCQTGCQVSCQTGCEVACQMCNTCQTACELSCQTGCEVSCQTGCEVACQTGCEVSCQTGCEVSCQSGCEVACQTGCEVSCQTGCEVSCQTGCEVACQNCQTCQACDAGCQEGEGGCEPYCYACESCQTCESCQATCQGCQTTCELSCQTACQLSCQGCYGCYTCQACEAGCQFGEGGCEPYCYACESCQTCESGQS